MSRAGATWLANVSVLLLTGLLGCGAPNFITPNGSPALVARLASMPSQPVSLGPTIEIRAVEVENFVLPQVRLADTAAMRRINEALVRLMLSEFFTPDGDTLNFKKEPHALLRQAWGACCTDPETGQYQPGQGLTGCGYEVLHNDGRLLSFALNLEITGAYSWNSVRHAVFDVRMGRQLSIEQVLDDPPAQLRQRLRMAINERTAETLADVLEQEAGDTTLVNDLAHWFHWNPTTRQVLFAEMGEGDFPDIGDFIVTHEGVILFNLPYLPHPIANYAPEAAHLFPFAGVHLRASWLHLLELPPPTAGPE